MDIIRENDTLTTRWSGGTTTQLAIRPSGAVYADRDFLWRLSTAVVLDEESTFTPLPDYNRWLTTREGTLRLRHDDGDWYDLAPGEITFFDGGVRTESRGKVTDFNLMLRKGQAEGCLAAARLSGRGDPVSLAEAVPGQPFPADGETAGLYVSDGGPLTVRGKDTVILQPGEMILCGAADAPEEWVLSAERDSLLIRFLIRAAEIR